MLVELREHLERHLSWPELSDVERTRFLTLALCGEVGELAELLGNGHKDMAEHVMHSVMRDEMADVGNYFFMLALHRRLNIGDPMPAYEYAAGPRSYRRMVLELCAETGKLANLVKKDWRGDPGNSTDRNISLTMAMARIHVCLLTLAAYLGVDLYAAMLAKLIEVEKRPSWQEAHR